MNTLTGNMDPYVYPGTSVLKNLRDIRDLAVLSRFEMDMTTRRLSELLRAPTQGQFNTRHVLEIHRYIFQDVFSWAGEFRTVNISLPEQAHFAFVQQIPASLDRLLGGLAEEGRLADKPEEFVGRAAYFLGELNAIHPFRDGNGRAQREFIRQLASVNGYSLDWFRVSRDQMYAASHQSFRRGDSAALAQVLRKALSARGKGRHP